MSGSPSMSFISTKDRFKVASDSGSNRQSLVCMPMVRSYSRDITVSLNWVMPLVIFTVSALFARI